MLLQFDDELSSWKTALGMDPGELLPGVKQASFHFAEFEIGFSFILRPKNFRHRLDIIHVWLLDTFTARKHPITEAQNLGLRNWLSSGLESGKRTELNISPTEHVNLKVQPEEISSLMALLYLLDKEQSKR